MQKIGQFVQSVIPDIIALCSEHDSEEFIRLQDSKYSLEMFKISYPFWKLVSTIGSHEHRRYYSNIYQLLGQDVRICNDWYEPKNRAALEKYLFEKGIIKELNVERSFIPYQERNRTNNSRYKRRAIGDTQNALIRNILSNLGNESFSENDWQATKDFFNNSCAYCGNTTDKLEIEHAIPINKKDLGEHRLGNIVPSCKRCNSSKHFKTYKKFLENDVNKIVKIERYMEEKKYIPLSTAIPLTSSIRSFSSLVR